MPPLLLAGYSVDFDAPVSSKGGGAATSDCAAATSCRASAANLPQHLRPVAFVPRDRIRRSLVFRH
jgi:hypothetical protein